jgi:hypothetical protein
MSIEVETDQVLVPETSAQEPTVPRSTTFRPRWRRRRYQFGGVAIGAVLIAAFAGNNLLASQYTPEGTVRQYLSALQAGDANKAWDAIQVAVPTAAVTAKYIDHGALEAAFVAGKPDMTSFTVTNTSRLSASTTSVEVVYDTSSGSKQAKFIAQRSGQTHFGIYPAWHLMISPTLLQITLPKGSDGVSIDGRKIALPDGKSTLAVLPVLHKVQFNSTAMIAVQTVSVDGFLSLSQSVAYQPKLTAAGIEKAKAAVKAAFDACAQKTIPNASDAGCPQSASMNKSTAGHWRIEGDPAQDLTVSFDQSLTANAIGHYQMVMAYEDHGTQHELAAGAYLASLVLAPGDITVGSIGPTRDAPDLKRPAGATDQAAKDLVAKRFVECAKATADRVADCPQYLFDVLTSNVGWSMTGDPLAGATVGFDPANGVITVQGNVPMTASYLVGGRSQRTRPSFTRTYGAFLVWDGQGVQLVTIIGYI